jgi:hypothetical protein
MRPGGAGIFNMAGTGFKVLRVSDDPQGYGLYGVQQGQTVLNDQ